MGPGGRKWKVGEGGKTTEPHLEFAFSRTKGSRISPSTPKDQDLHRVRPRSAGARMCPRARARARQSQPARQCWRRRGGEVGSRHHAQVRAGAPLRPVLGVKRAEHPHQATRVAWQHLLQCHPLLGKGSAEGAARPWGKCDAARERRRCWPWLRERDARRHCRMPAVRVMFAGVERVIPPTPPPRGHTGHARSAPHQWTRRAAGGPPPCHRCTWAVASARGG